MADIPDTPTNAANKAKETATNAAKSTLEGIKNVADDCKDFANNAGKEIEKKFRSGI